MQNKRKSNRSRGASIKARTFRRLSHRSPRTKRPRRAAAILDFFRSFACPSDFFAATAKMRPGEMSRPLRTSLGFHIVQITDLKPLRQMSLEEAHPDIDAALEHEKRRAALQKLDVDLSASVRFVGSFLLLKDGGGI